jgi:hypothetical protein
VQFHSPIERKRAAILAVSMQQPPNTAEHFFSDSARAFDRLVIVT